MRLGHLLPFLIALCLPTLIACDADDESTDKTRNANDGGTGDRDGNMEDGSVDAGCLDDDGDGVCNDADICSEGDDTKDEDSDTVPDACDACPGKDDRQDDDKDGVPDDCDVCPDFDDKRRDFANPNFLTNSDWVTGSGTSIDKDATGHDDKGEGLIPGTAVCMGGEIKQDICMPPYSEATGPYAVTLGVDLRCASGECSNAFRVGYQGARTFSPSEYYNVSGYQDETLCIGEAGYGGAMEFSFGSTKIISGASCNPLYELDFAIDNAHIGPAKVNTCPAPGEVLNGDFEDGTIGWDAGDSDGLFEVITDGASKVAHLRFDQTDESCYASIRGKVSLRESKNVPFPALQFRWKGTGLTNGQGFLQIGVHYGPGGGSDNFSATADNGSYKTEKVCLYGGQGAVVPVEINFSRYQMCGVATSDLWMDDLTVVNDPSCGA
ncbi:MAG: hypothetical protein KC416_00140 [Myxococcales bacterium]|nr:hypothetical protein [Myxococcales bacterium]